MSRYECIDFKVMLSAYLDGEIDTAQRKDADRHLLACSDCRALMEQAERNDEAMRSLCARDAAFAEKAGSALPLPAGFEATVLHRTRRRQHVHLRRVYRSFGGSFGLLAAAASLALGAALFFVVRAGRDNGADNNSNFVNDEGWERLGNGVHGPPRPPHGSTQDNEKPRALNRLTDDESQALHSAATALATIVVTPFEDLAARDRLRQTVLYDELVERLVAMRSKFDPAARRQLDATRATLYQLVRDRPEVELWSQLQEDLRLLELPSMLDAIASESDARDSV